MKRKISILLALLLLSNATGIGYGQHFCGGHLMKSMFAYSEAGLHCGMEKTPASCENGTTSKSTVHHKDCCENQLHQVSTDENFNSSSVHFDFQKNFTSNQVSVFYFEQLLEIVQKPAYKYYNPPPIGKDLHVLYRVFLI